MDEKIRENHLNRKAFIYIRQSSERQVQQHAESGRIQYALVERARSLGWEHPVTIDDDLGKSAAWYSERSGFQNLVTRVSMGVVGIVISLEATRLARCNRDWYHLIDLCTIFDTLIGDHQGIYDPKNPNDRMLLGLKGTMSEAELNLIKFRMQQGRESKARRGELFAVVPTGYILNGNGIIEKSACLREQEIIGLIFKKFTELGSGKQTYLWFIEEKISVPVNGARDREGKTRRWHLPTYSFIMQLLRNPFYAGAYVYGRTECRVAYKEGRIKKTRGHLKGPEKWQVLIHNHHEGYISWKQYENNMETVRNNQYKAETNEAIGAIRKGKALLVGILRCQRCGRKMHVRYWGKGGTHPTYQCSGDYYHAGSYCQSFSAIKCDRIFEEELFKAIEPAALQAGIEATREVTLQYQDKISCLSKELESAKYEADRAFTQYNLIDPLNRLAASELERRWNEKLAVVSIIEERMGKMTKEITQPTKEEIKKILSLKDHLPQIWRHPKTDPAIKKRIIRMLVKEVLVHLDKEALLITMTIHWQGGIHTQVQFKRPRRGEPPQNKTDEQIVELLRKLSYHYPDEEIARVFNCLKLKTGSDNPWNRTRVRGLRSKNKIAPFDRTKKTDVVSLNEAAKVLDVPHHAIRGLIKKGVIGAKQIIKYAPFKIERSQLEKESVKAIVKQLKSGQTLKYIDSVGDRQMSLF
jgi:DNA invertase Pin-like site-specific DNA recombinase